MDLERNYENFDKWSPLIDKGHLRDFAVCMEDALRKMDEIEPTISGPLRRSLGVYMKRWGKGFYSFILTANKFCTKEVSSGFDKLKMHNALQWTVEAQVLKFADLFD